jgi:hypothetical protein
LNTTEDRVFTPEEAARELKVSPSFLAKARMNGTGPEFIRCGRAIRYTQSGLNAYKVAQTHTSTSQYLAKRQLLEPRGKRSVSNRKRPLKKPTDQFEQSSIPVYQHQSRSTSVNKDHYSCKQYNAMVYT